ASTSDSAKGVGFAKTMMFAGGSAEAQNLVKQALAARAEANGAAPPATGPNVTQPIALVASEQPRDPNATPPPVAPLPGAEPPGPRRTHGAAIAATMVALPAAGKLSSSIPGAVGRPADVGDSGSMQVTPPPVAAAPPPAAGAGPARATGAAAFRETLWFKQGDVDQMVADARAKLETARAKGVPAPGPEPEVPPDDAKPLDERYRDDGSLSVDDRKKYSLRSGATSAALPTVGGVVPGDRMSAEEMMGEIGGGKRTAIIVAALAVVVAVVIGLYLTFRGKHVAQSAAALTPVQVPTAAAPPAPPPPPPAAVPAAPAAAAPAKAAAAPAKAAAAPAKAADDEEEDQPAAKGHPAAAKKHSAKKSKGKKHH